MHSSISSKLIVIELQHNVQGMSHKGPNYVIQLTLRQAVQLKPQMLLSSLDPFLHAFQQ